MSYPSYTPRTRAGLQPAPSPSPLRQTSTASASSSIYSGGAPSRSSTLSSNATNASHASNGSNGSANSAYGHRRGLSEGITLSTTRAERSYSLDSDSNPANTYLSMRKALRPLPQVPQGSPVPDKTLRPNASSGPPSPEKAVNPYSSSSLAPRDLPVRTLAPPSSPGRTESVTRPRTPTTPTHADRPVSPYAAVSPGRPDKTPRAYTSPSHLEKVVPGLAPPAHIRAHSVDQVRPSPIDGASSPTTKPRPLSMALSRADTVRSPVRHASPHLDRPDLEKFGKSSTGYLRTLSQFAQSASEEDFAIKSPEQEVVGLHGRRRLQRTDKDRKDSSGWVSRNWMDRQRQFLQAYEYLCHIGEAKEWIEDIIHKDIPPIVQLEEALRDGVTLAEIVQAITGRTLRIFRDPKLQYRHSNNYAHFFQFLSEVELPELFRFELVDLYEKKNVPKVIYCIHALSWLLFRRGMVDFCIGNLVGKLQFEDHELEAMQKGLDNSGVAMPNFSSMQANFAVEPEPEPEPVESEADRIDRELGENEAIILDLQAQIRGAMKRMQLGDMMQELWDYENAIVDLQSRIRGDWARQIFQYRLDMKRFAITLQSAARGFLIRSRLRGQEEYWQDKEPEVVKLQSLFRGRKARTQVQHTKSVMQHHEQGIREFQAAIRGALSRLRASHDYDQTRMSEAGVLQVQAMIRGALLRLRIDRDWTNLLANEAGIAQLQAMIRGFLFRQNFKREASDIKTSEAAIEKVQGLIRGALLRQKMDREMCELEENEARIAELQANARAMLLRKSFRADQENLWQHESVVTLLQAAARGLMARKKDAAMRESLVSTDVDWTALYSKVRGDVVRNSVKQLQDELSAETPQIVDLQAIARGRQLRSGVAETLAQLEDQEPLVTSLQSYMRGFMSRQRHYSDLKALQEETPTIIDLQSACRGFIQRQRTYEQLCDLNNQEPEIIQLQAMARGMLHRMQLGLTLAEVEEHEDLVVELQGLARAMLVRRKFVEKQKFYHENMEKVIKIQSFVRGRQQGEAYKSLTSGKNPPVSTVKNFVHLLNDSDIDFDEEIEFERLRKTVVQHVRQNELAEQYIDQLDIKIALLVKNKITLDEVVKHQKHFGGHVGALLSSKDISSKDPFDLKALNKNSRRKLEHYQELFFMLQTHPEYMARLFRHIREQSLPEKDQKRIEQLTMSLFGLAQKRREEYYLLKLIGRSLKEEVVACDALQDYTRGTFFWGKLFNSFVRSPRDRKYLKDLFGVLIKENIIDNEALDLESDPMQIYRSAINNEELRTGQRSYRDPNVSRDQAIKDPETRELFIHHLQDLRDIADQFFSIMEELLHRMPYGVRYIAQQTFEELRAKFSYEPQEQLLQIAGQWVWKQYLQPALLQPQHWGVVDRALSPLMNRNLGEVAKVLGQIASGRLFGGENIYLQPLNGYVTEAIDRLQEIWSNLINVRDAEAQYEIDEFNDLFARTKPTLYIKLADVFSIHNLVVDDLTIMCPSQDDPLRETIRELGSAKNNENQFAHVSSTEITLTLNPKFHEQEDPDAPIKALFMETKRFVLYIIRIQTGANLMEIMCRPITPEDEQRWDELVRSELAQQSRSHRRSQSVRSSAASTYTADPSSQTTNILDMDFTTLKRACLENILTLQRVGRISQHNNYQDLLNAIAVDIRTKHRRRIQRAKELEQVRATLQALDEKAVYLDQQLKSYNDYIEQAMITLSQNKHSKKRRFLLPFTRQYNHMRELQRSGREYRFGSFKYSARNLAEKGILVAWAGYPERMWEKLDITISSNVVGVFEIQGSQGSVAIPGAFAEVPLDGLLQAQFDNHQFMNVFEGSDAGGGGGKGAGARLNVNLFLHLIFKKFYRDE